MKPESFVELLREERAVAILRCGEAAIAPQAMEVALRAGFRLVEVTLTTPGALDIIREASRRPGVVAGAGTVLTVEEADAAVAAGASFLVSPVMDPAVISRAKELGAASIPGCHTPTEMLNAHRAGSPLMKLFPAPAAGPLWLRSLLAPLPFLKVVPTNGVDAGNAREWLAAGAWGLGFAGVLFTPEDLRERRFDRMEERALRILEAVRGATVTV